MPIQCKFHANQIIQNVCIDYNCKQQKLLCKICQQQYHAGHNSQPILTFLEHSQQNLQSKVNSLLQFIAYISELIITYQEPNQSHIFYNQFEEFLEKNKNILENELSEQVHEIQSFRQQNQTSTNSQKATSVSQNQGTSNIEYVIDKSNQQSQVHIIDYSFTNYFQSSIIQEQQEQVYIPNQKDESQEFFEKGMREFNLKNYQLSIEQFDKAITYKKDFEQAWVYKILSYGESKQNNKAIDECEIAKNYCNNSDNLCSLHGILLQENKRYKEALVQFNVVIKNNDKNIKCLYEAGISSFELQLYDQAQEYFQKILILIDDEMTYLMQGRIAIEMGDNETAIFCFDQCVRLNEKTQARFYLALIYINVNQIKNAQFENEIYCRNFENDLKGKLQRGQILLLNNEYDKAIQIFNELKQKDPTLESRIKQIIDSYTER